VIQEMMVKLVLPDRLGRLDHEVLEVNPDQKDQLDYLEETVVLGKEVHLVNLG